MNNVPVCVLSFIAIMKNKAEPVHAKKLQYRYA